MDTKGTIVLIGMEGCAGAHHVGCKLLRSAMTCY